MCAILWSFIDMPSECYINARHVMASVIDGKQHNCILHTFKHLQDNELEDDDVDERRWSNRNQESRG